MLKLVYGCLAFSTVAFVILIVASYGSGSPFRGTTAQMIGALTEEAIVLDADSRGAVIQTGNGRVLGYRRGQENPVWSFKFDRFPDSDSGQWDAQPPSAQAWCAGECPSAIALVGGTARALGGASEALAETLNSNDLENTTLLSVTARDRAFVNVSKPGSQAAQLAVINGSKVEDLPAQNSTVAFSSSSGTRAIAATEFGNVGRLSRMIRAGNKWRIAAPTIDELDMKNICLSSDGRWVGAVSRRALLMPFISNRVFGAGNPVTGGICRADSTGYTLSVNPASRPGLVAASRVTHDGRRVWARTFGSVELLSGTGSPRIVVRDRQKVITAIDAVSGKLLLRQRVPGQPFVGDDGAIVTASRTGVPFWVVAAP